MPQNLLYRLAGIFSIALDGLLKKKKKRKKKVVIIFILLHSCM